MRNKWILDVLADMRAFARANSLPRLAEALDDTALIAAAELEDQKPATVMDQDTASR